MTENFILCNQAFQTLTTHHGAAHRLEAFYFFRFNVTCVLCSLFSSLGLCSLSGAALHLWAGLISGRAAAALALGTEPSVALDQGSDPLPFRSAPLPQVALIRDFSGTLPSLGH